MRKSPVKPGVLLVEDDPIQAECYRRMLDEHYDLFLAPDTKEAEILLARNPHLQVLLCDQEMPGEQGLAYCRKLQRRESPLIRILMTGHTETDFLVEAINSKALFHYLHKPFSREALLDVLRKAERAYAETQKALEARLALEALGLTQPSLLKRMIGWAQMVIGVGSMALVTLLIVTVLVAIVGLCLLLLLYFLKSFLGIDIFKDSHLSDWI